MSAKLTYVLTTIPAAVHGGVLSVTYTMAVSVGISYFQYTNIDSGRNIFIIGFTMFMALLTPHWFIRNPDYIVTGTLEERGLVTRFPSFKPKPKDGIKVYQLPPALQKYLWEAICCVLLSEETGLDAWMATDNCFPDRESNPGRGGESAKS
ncbi:hypothetical protein chiPu_0007789 [Chiloscyllium punctatum]|uniref:Uncharacterized protein n=1 Tax=Chiloscyllium punctatum TaxID=137246 RepID=A0A401SG14_CHIPU|nr:hypothetical protein [Chiloscyllium punctatum]